MNCCVNNCPNNSEQLQSSKEISFYPFPEDSQLRQIWMEALDMDVDPDENTAVCSEHFGESDFYVVRFGMKKLKRGATPVAGIKLEDFDAPAALRVCRICLVIDVRLYNLKDYNLGDNYHQMTGIIWKEDDLLPQRFCWECAGRLMSSYRLFEKALRSHKLLMGVLQTSKYVKLKDVKAISRLQNGLQSNLTENISNNDCDILMIENDKYEKEIKEEELTERTTAEPLQVETEIPPLITVEVKDEQGDAFFDEFDHFDDSDDNIKLSEVAERPEKVKKSKVKKKKIEKVEKVQKVAKAVKERRRKDEEENPVSTMDKYKTSDVKRRKPTDGLDESLFNISNMSYEEQIADIQKRQDTNAYKNAPFKCTVCFRGFQIQERYTAHAVRHSEQSGLYECFICKTRLKTGRALRKHLTAQHTEKFSCKGCPFVTRNRGVAREHEKWHAGTKYQCPHCPSEFDKVTTYMGHIRIKHVSDFVCELCGFTFVSKKGIDVHKKKKHRLFDKNATLEGPYCCVCDVTFVSEEAHSRHLKLSSRHSSDNDPNRIRNDSQSMHTEGNGRVMRKIERRPVIHPRDPNSMAEDLENGGPITCEQCGILLRDLRLYAQHFRRAHPDKNRTKYPSMKTPCMCEQCGRIFQSMALLKDHMWVHTGEKRFKCDRCEKSFTQKTNLVFHMRVHSSTRPTYECPLCGKHFAFFNNRRRHMFIHTGLKPFKCDTCGKSFTTAGEHRAHVEHVHLKKPWPKRARGSRQSSDDWHKCAMQHVED